MIVVELNSKGTFSSYNFSAGGIQKVKCTNHLIQRVEQLLCLL